MRPVVTDRVAWSVGLFVYLSVCHSSEPCICKNGWTDQDALSVVGSASDGPKESRVRRGSNVPWLRIRMGPRNRVLGGAQITPCEWTFFREMTCRGYARRHSAVSCAKMAEPIDMLFGLWTRVSPRKHAFGGVHSAHWRHLTNTSVPSMCGGDAAFLSNYFDHLFYLLYATYRISLY